jgi:RNA polymerase sigma-70 factor, ECF subfamily
MTAQITTQRHMDDSSEIFEALRPQLFRVAYGILGSVAEAEEIVQDAWLRLSRTDRQGIENLAAWLKTVVARLALDALHSARSRRETYVGEWLPEPLVSTFEESISESQVTIDEAVAGALLVVLERLTPAERTSFLLHDTFGMSFVEIADLVGRTPEAVRQLAARARRNVAAAKPRFPVSQKEQKKLVLAFAVACATGDLEQLLNLLDPSVVFRSDGGGKVSAARLPIEGAERVGRAVIALTRHELDQEDQPTGGRFAWVNGAPGMITRSTAALTVLSFAFDEDRIVAVHAVRNPEKLGHVRFA